MVEAVAGPAIPESESKNSEEQVGGSLPSERLAFSSGNQGNQGNPMYFLLQPQFGGVETKAQRGRDRGRGRNLTWNGMGGSSTDMNTASEISGEKEITVQKME